MKYRVLACVALLLWVPTQTLVLINTRQYLEASRKRNEAEQARLKEYCKICSEQKICPVDMVWKVCHKTVDK